LRIVWSREADEDLLQIWLYLASKTSDAVADNQVSKIEQASGRLQDGPKSGRSRDSIVPGMRSVVVAPWVMFYRLFDDHVQIVRVLHGHRDIESIFTDEP